MTFAAAPWPLPQLLPWDGPLPELLAWDGPLPLAKPLPLAGRLAPFTWALRLAALIPPRRRALGGLRPLAA